MDSMVLHILVRWLILNDLPNVVSPLYTPKTQAIAGAADAPSVDKLDVKDLNTPIPLHGASCVLAALTD